MDKTIQKIYDRQQTLLTQIQTKINVTEYSTSHPETDALKSLVDELNNEIYNAKQRTEKLSEQIDFYKNFFYENSINEKSKLIVNEKLKRDLYFKNSSEQLLNELDSIELSAKKRIDNMSAVLRRNNIAVNDDVYTKINELSAYINNAISALRNDYNKANTIHSAYEDIEYANLQNSPVTADPSKISSGKKTFTEQFVGLNIINIIGLILIIIGVVAAAKYTLWQISDVVKSSLIFALGGGLLLFGEFLNRKKANIFSLGLTASGVSILYIAVAVSYFMYKIFSFYPAAGICIIITACVLLLAVRYNSRTILTFALLGGYLPLISDPSDNAAIYSLMIYMILLNIPALYISFKRKWYIPTFTGLFLNIIGSSYITFLCLDNPDSLQKVCVLFFTLVSFSIYFFIPLAGTLAEKTAFRKSDIILFSINIFHCGVNIYALFNSFIPEKYNVLPAIIFAIYYLSIGLFINKKYTCDKYTHMFFYLVALTYTALIFPLHFGMSWLIISALTEGVAITIYGIIKNNSGFSTTGFIICAIFIWFFFAAGINSAFDDFPLQYFLITIGGILITGAYIFSETLSPGWPKTYACLSIVNLWFYSIYICSKAEDLFNPVLFVRSECYSALASILFTFIIALFVPKIKYLSFKAMKILSGIIGAIGIFGLFVMNASVSLYSVNDPAYMVIINFLLYTLVMIFSVLTLNEVITLLSPPAIYGNEKILLYLSFYSIIILTQTLYTQLKIPINNLYISIFYVLAALAWIIIGFIKRYPFMRKFGLGLSLFSLVKLFLFDLHNLQQGYRILSYFALGITFISISFVYQYYNNFLEFRQKKESTGYPVENETSEERSINENNSL